MTRFGLTIWAWQVTGRATALALVGLFSLVPMLLLSPYAGAVVDRWSRKWIMILGDVVAGVSTIFLLILFMLDKLEIWHIYSVAVVSGAGEAFQRPAYMASISTMTPKKHYGRAQGMIGMVGSATGIIAPAAAGALLGFIGIEGIMLFDVVSFLFAVSMLLVVRIPQPEPSDDGRQARGSILRDSVFGFRFLVEKRPLLYLLSSYAALNVFLTMCNTAISPMILARTATNERILGGVQMFFGFGGLASGAVLSIWGGPRRQIRAIFLCVIGTMISGPIILGIGTHVVTWAVGAFCLVFFAQLAAGMNGIIWQNKVPHDVQGRVFAYRGMLGMIASPIGMILAGTLADYLFEPMIRAGAWGESVFGWLVGTGAGAGMGLLMVFAGIMGGILGLSGFVTPQIRKLETLLPDCEPAAGADAVDCMGPS